VPISSDFFPEQAIRRSKLLGEKFKSRIHFLYVVEKKTVEKMEDTGRHVLTPMLIEELERNIYKTQLESISKTVMARTRKFMKGMEDRCEFFVRKGEFSTEIVSFIHERTGTSNKIACVMLEYRRISDLNYRIFDSCSVPIWIERGGATRIVFGATTSLSRNKLVPVYTEKISQAFGARSILKHFPMDEKGVTTDKQGQSIISSGIETHWHGVSNVEKEILRHAEGVKADLLIIGRTCKASNFLGFGTHLPKVAIGKRADMSVLIMYS